MKNFFKKTWVFFVVAVVVLLSVALQLGLIDVSRNAAVQTQPQKAGVVEKIETPIENIGGNTLQVEESEEDYDYLITLNRSAITLPQAKDISAEKAAGIGAKIISQVFDVDLNGEICNVSYTDEVGVNPNMRWDAWSVRFGDSFEGTYYYIAVINSVSGQVVSAYKFQNLVYDEQEMYAEEIDPEQKEDYFLECVDRASEVAEKYFFTDKTAGAVEWADLYGVTFNTQRGYVTVYPSANTTSGSGINFGFCQSDGGLVSLELLDYVGDSDTMLSAEEISVLYGAETGEENSQV